MRQRARVRDRLLLYLVEAFERMPLGPLSERDRTVVERFMASVGEQKTVEHGRLWYELIWCQKELIERHRDRVLGLVREMIATTAYTPTVAVAPSTWSEARILALKRNCPDCLWWRGKACAARDLAADTEARGQLPGHIAEALRDCRRDEAGARMAVRIDEMDT